MNVIKFSHNWNNKLDNDVFTTIRNFNQGKWEYYKDAMGSEFNVALNGVFHSKADLIEVQKYNYYDIDRHILVLDTGMTDPDQIESLILS